MPTLDERITQEIAKLEQLKRQKKTQEAQDKKRTEAINRNRQQIIGEIVSKYFPEVLQFQPHRTNDENIIEFTSLINFIHVLAANKELVARIKEVAARRTSTDNQQKL